MIYHVHDGGKDPINNGRQPLALHFFNSIKWPDFIHGARVVKMDGRGDVMLSHLTVDKELRNDLAKEVNISPETLFYWYETDDIFIKIEEKDVIIMPTTGTTTIFKNE